ncbi:MAG: hypothetical protein ACOCQR_00285 [bacterium]
MVFKKNFKKKLCLIDPFYIIEMRSNMEKRKKYLDLVNENYIFSFSIYHLYEMKKNNLFYDKHKKIFNNIVSAVTYPTTYILKKEINRYNNNDNFNCLLLNLSTQPFYSNKGMWIDIFIKSEKFNKYQKIIEQEQEVLTQAYALIKREYSHQELNFFLQALIKQFLKIYNPNFIFKNPYIDIKSFKTLKIIGLFLYHDFFSLYKKLNKENAFDTLITGVYPYAEKLLLENIHDRIVKDIKKRIFKCNILLN